MTGPATTVFTIGHSTLEAERFVELLAEHRIEIVVDVRRHPGSRRHPQFGREALASDLARHGIGYRHEVDLGGRRAPRAGSPNTAWRNAQFRGYADHMDSAEFRSALDRVIALASGARVAVMCAEQHPSRCHRRLLSDALLVRKVDVEHVLGPGRSEPHVLTPEARASEGRLVYPASESHRGAAEAGGGLLPFA